VKFRRLVLAGAMALLLTVAVGAPASANIAWCVYDPPALVVSAEGSYVMVNNSYYFSPQEVKLARLITTETFTSPDGTGGTLITVQVQVPHGMKALYVVSANYRYQVSAEGGGTGGTVITLNLDVPIA